jgi:ketol-acid reductoisomerase
LYESVAAGKEAAKSIESNSKADYREKLEEELKELRESELWQAGKTVRGLRPENQEPGGKSDSDKRFQKLKFSSPLYND